MRWCTPHKGVLVSTLWFCFVLLPNSNSRSLNGSRNASSPAPKGQSHPNRQSVNFIDGQCPPASSSAIKDNDNKCQDIRRFCQSDTDCEEDKKCCRKGCSFICIEPWFPRQVVDWTKSSSNKISELDPALELQRKSSTLSSAGAPCSTSVLGGMEPLRCPTQYTCVITMPEDKQLNIPNRGECVRTSDQASKQTQENERNSLSPENSAECFYRGKQYKHGDKFDRDCNRCVCYNGVVFCQNNPCPIRVGIPGTVTKLEEQTHPWVFTDEEESGSAEDSSSDDESGSAGEIVDEKRRNEETDEASGSTKEDGNLDSTTETVNVDRSGEETSRKAHYLTKGKAKEIKENLKDENGELSDRRNSTFTRETIQFMKFLMQQNIARNFSLKDEDFVTKIVRDTRPNLNDKGQGLESQGNTTSKEKVFHFKVESVKGQEYEKEILVEKYNEDKNVSTLHKLIRPEGFISSDKVDVHSPDEIRLKKHGGYFSGESGDDYSSDDEGESGSSQDDTEGSVNYSGSGHEKVEFPTLPGKNSKAYGSGFTETIVLQRWRPGQNERGERGFDFTKDGENAKDGPRQERSKTKPRSLDENVGKKTYGSSLRRFRMHDINSRTDNVGKKSSEYLATTDDER